MQWFGNSPSKRLEPVSMHQILYIVDFSAIQPIIKYAYHIVKILIVYQLAVYQIIMY